MQQSCFIILVVVFVGFFYCQIHTLFLQCVVLTDIINQLSKRILNQEIKLIAVTGQKASLGNLLKGDVP